MCNDEQLENRRYAIFARPEKIILVALGILIAVMCWKHFHRGPQQGILEKNADFDRLLAIGLQKKGGSPPTANLRTIWLKFPDELELKDVYVQIDDIIVIPSMDGKKYHHDYGKEVWCYIILTTANAEVDGSVYIHGVPQKFYIPKSAGDRWFLTVTKEGTLFKVIGSGQLIGSNM